MSDDSILSDYQISKIAVSSDLSDDPSKRTAGFARLVERFVMQSEQVQAWKTTAEKYSTVQPRETAPTDGTEILGIFSDGSVQMMKWVVDEGDDTYTGWSVYDNLTGGTLYELAIELHEYEDCYLLGWLPVPRPDLSKMVV